MDALPEDGYHEGRGQKSLRCARGRIKHDLKTEPMPVIMDSDAQKEAAGMRKGKWGRATAGMSRAEQKQLPDAVRQTILAEL